ncbi:MAG: TolC family protein [Gemmatimonadaceae bacterium]
MLSRTIQLVAIGVAARSASAQSPDSLTLEQSLTRALASRPQVVVASAAVERARGQHRVAGMIPNPSAQIQRDELAPTRTVTLVQPLAWIPRRAADRSATRAMVAGAVADSAQLIAEIGRQVRRAFFAALAADERMRLLNEQAVLADSLVILAERRVAAGDISALERDQVAQEAARARLASLQAREGARVARIDFARAVGGTPGDAPSPAGSLADALDQSADSSRLMGGASSSTFVPPDAISTLPGMRTALADSTAAAARYRSARWAQLPVPSLIAGREWGGEPLLRNSAILGLTLPFPIWNQGREATAEARAAARGSAARAAEMRLSLVAEVEGMRIRAIETATRARFARDSLLPEARRIRAAGVRLYEAGRTGIISVFDALRVERDVVQTLVQELLAFQEARADLIARLGRWR